MDESELRTIAAQERDAWKPSRVLCCNSTGCQSSRSLEVMASLQEAVESAAVSDRVQVVGVGCIGFCSRGPLVAVSEPLRLYQQVTPEHAASLIGSLAGGKPESEQCDLNHPFFTSQVRIARETGGMIDPERIEEYIALGGYQSLHHALYEMTPAAVIKEISDSGLRGRGGAGYPTGLKWATVAKQPVERKYVVCNADEGDPGAFMDRSLLESDPHRVLEGMAIAGYAVGAREAFIYVRAEYLLAVERLETAIKQAKQYGLLGSQILGSTFDFKIDIRIGAGAYVCGEETALIHSIEGQRGVPRPRPPYPAESGLWGYPTLINNVETFANIAGIIKRGAAWFAAIGTETSKGTKLFALAGNVANAGLVEVPMGTTLRYIVEVMGGGVTGNGRVKAVQTGGPSGGCVPAEHLDTPVDYESLKAVGSIMGSGGMIVMDEKTNMVDVARFFMEFCKDESCGKCIPCRAGTVQLHRILDRIVQGDGTSADIEKLEALCDMVKHTSLCGLGQSAPNPVLSTLRYFREEYDELVRKDAVHAPRS
jgi:bidirectional [NiFe] hydrogenase diaphorase subunit